LDLGLPTAAPNLATFVVYGGMGVVFFLFVVTLLVIAGYSPIAAAASMVPITNLMLLLRAGVRWPRRSARGSR
jgi:hypothetical protein